MARIIKLSSFKYVLDWYEIKDVEFDLDEYSYFYMEERLGNWYLCPYRRINNDEGKCSCCGNYWKYDTDKGIQLNDPVNAVLALGQKLKGYRSLHNNSHFPEVLEKLMASVQRVRDQNCVTNIPAEYWIEEHALENVWGNANFGENTNRRLIILDTLLKVASDFTTGHTAMTICKELGLIGKSGLTKKGRKVMYYFNKYKNSIERAY